MNSPSIETPSSGPHDLTPAPTTTNSASNLDYSLSNIGGGPPNQKPQTQIAPAAAPDPLSSDAEEAQPPHKRSRKNRPRNRKPAPAQLKPTPAQLKLDDMFGPRSEMWTRFHIIRGPETLCNAKIFNDLTRKLKDKFKCYRRKDGSILIDAKTKRNSEDIENMTKIVDKDITATRDQGMNSVRGTILIPDRQFEITEDLEEQILEQLATQKVPASKVTVYRKTSRTGKTITIASIVFESRALPSKVTVGFEEIDVREDLPKPRQCRACWKFGHPATGCRSIHCCPVCGDPRHGLNDCPHKGNYAYKGHCPNCDEDGHTAFSKQCPHYRKEEEILLLSYKQGIPKYKAREIVNDMGMFAGMTYARRTAQANQASQQPEPQPNQQHQEPTQQPRQNEDHRKQQPQQFQEEPQQHQENEATQPKQQEHSTEATSQATPESQMEVLFGGSEDVFLSVEPDSVEHSSIEECQPQQQPSSRKKQGLPPPPTLDDEPVQTSSPRKPNDPLEASKHNNLEKDDDPQPPTPKSKVVVLESLTGAIAKRKTEVEQEDDGQHTDDHSCGCHNCITELAVIKGEAMKPGKEISRRFQDILGSRRIFRNTPLKSHPSPCMCITHLQRRDSLIPKLEKYTGKASKHPSLNTSNGSVTRLRNQFEPYKRIDPRTSAKAKPQAPKDQGPSNIIPVHTSR